MPTAILMEISNILTRSAKKAKQLKIENGGKAVHNAAGKITQAAAFQSRELPKARIEVRFVPFYAQISSNFKTA